MSDSWQFWIDRGGTFTDIVAVSPGGRILTHKLLSQSPKYPDAVLQGIEDVLLNFSHCNRDTAEQEDEEAVGQEFEPKKNAEQAGTCREGTFHQPLCQIAEVRLGTTVATNALLEHKGERTLLAVTAGFADQIRIGYQNRPDIFALDVKLPVMLYERVISIEERIDAQGNIVKPLNEVQAKQELQLAYNDGFRAIAIVFMHAYKYSAHEQQLAKIAGELGYKQISVSHEVVPLPKFVSRGDTTLADAYLSPALKRYIKTLKQKLPGTRLYFMQSNGGLAQADHFQGKDSILSGPAGGIIAAVKTATRLGEHKIITFDMGGTSTDVAHYAGELERCHETEIAGIRLRVPMLAINTVAAGGGSILHYEAGRFRVGPDSAGAAPGPASYGRGGPLTITDCNVLLGRIQPDFFPHLFGADDNSPLNVQIVAKQFIELAACINAGSATSMTPEAVAYGFLQIAVENMANAIKQVSTQKGRNPADYTLCCFGGAGAQHACAIAKSLGISKILIHRYSGVLSAYGMGLADLTVIHEVAVEQALSDALPQELESTIIAAIETARAKLLAQQSGESAANQIVIKLYADIRYEGADFSLRVPMLGSAADLRSSFSQAHQQRYGCQFHGRSFVVDKLLVEAIVSAPAGDLETEAKEIIAESMADAGKLPENAVARERADAEIGIDVRVSRCAVLPKMAEAFFDGAVKDVPLYRLADLKQNEQLRGPAIIVEPNSTIVCESDWSAKKLADGSLLLMFTPDSPQNEPVFAGADSSKYDISAPHPVLLELFNNLFMFVAEQMGVTLQNTSYSVNIKERLDFSCAIFDGNGNLVANAPHIPVHLGSMGDSVKELIERVGDCLRAGDVYALNDPYHGGTHLPDITVISPFFLAESGQQSNENESETPDDIDQNLISGPTAGDKYNKTALVMQSQDNVNPVQVGSKAASPKDTTNQRNITGYRGGKGLNKAIPNSSGRPQCQNSKGKPLFYVASRGHHADIGGITPGSMPAHSRSIAEEGVLINLFQIVKEGNFLEEATRNLFLQNTSYPVRNPDQNIADLQAQIAANQRGLLELGQVIERYGLAMTQRYMQFVQDNGEYYVRALMPALLSGAGSGGEYESGMDCGAKIKVKISVNEASDEAIIDFTGSTAQMNNNFNAPEPVCKAAVMYVFRTLVAANIPLNAGCLRPLHIIIPPKSILSPSYPAAVVAGNVETSQVIVDTLYAALGIAAASQGTMNNLTFGNDKYQYYETIAGGMGATAHATGASAVQSHMTNSRMTDPEILELRYPVLIRQFSIRAGSGGNGLHTGGNGIIRRILFNERMHVSLMSNRRHTIPFGLRGGEPGQPGRAFITRCSGLVEQLDYCDATIVEPGDEITVETPGGGGFGKFPGSAGVSPAS